MKPNPDDQGHSNLNDLWAVLSMIVAVVTLAFASAMAVWRVVETLHYD